MRSLSNNRGFTLIELVIIIVILGVLAAVAIPKYQSLSVEAKEAAARASLGGIRSGITIYYANTAVKTGTATWPPADSLRTAGVVMEQSIPENPYCTVYPDSIQQVGAAVARGTLRNGSRPGWCYKPTTGEIWLNTNTVGENSW
ncbi:MAG: prepilin-type N-terminal cleavage/methylation domain-containing protein [bacterium]